MKIIKIILIAIISFTMGCSEEKTKTDKQFTYLALGDSYTIGQSVSEQERFPVQLVNLLNTCGIVVDSPQIVATTGWTTDELVNGIAQANISGTYDMVTLLIGVNNQYRGRSVENYEEEFQPILQQAIGFAGGDVNRVIVISIPDWGVTPYAEDRDREQIAMEIDAYNAVNKQIAENMGVYYVDVTPISREASDIPELIANDGLHPSGEMYRRWVELLTPIAKTMLK
jgi:lysophospholipase L1-like esterase